MLRGSNPELPAVRATRPFLRVLAALAVATLAGSPAWSKEWTRVRIATEGAYAPYNMHAPDGSLIGFEIDLAKDLCARMKVQCEVTAQDWDGMIPALNAGKFDAIMSGMSITARRREVIDFAGPYASVPTTFALAKSAGALPLTGQRVNLNDQAAAMRQLEPLRQALRGKVIGVQVSTIQAEFLNTYFKDAVEVRTYRTTEEHDLDLAAGRIDGVCAAAATIQAALEKGGGDAQMTGPMINGGPIGVGSGVGLRKGDPELREMFDNAIKAAAADGTLRTLALKWFKLDVTPQ